jgi:hypothetical protein
MRTRGELRIDPPAMEVGGKCGSIEIVVPFTERTVTEAVMKRVAATGRSASDAGGNYEEHVALVHVE